MTSDALPNAVCHICRAVLRIPSLRHKLSDHFPASEHVRGSEACRHLHSLIISSEGPLHSLLPQHRRNEILAEIDADLHRKGDGIVPPTPGSLDHGSNIRSFTSVDDVVQWETVATTAPVEWRGLSAASAEYLLSRFANNGIRHERQRSSGTDDTSTVRLFGCRMVFAFHKRMCQYKEMHAGCRFCQLSIGNHGVDHIAPELQIATVDRALSSTESWGGLRTVVEVLCDGSFLNPRELTQRVQFGLVDRIASYGGIFRLAIESRPEYCTVQAIEPIIERLRSDQQLEIYLGLETTDDFIAAVINDKGYGVREVRKSLEHIYAKIFRERCDSYPFIENRLRFSVYSLVKPPYLTDAEAIAEAVTFARDVDAMRREIGFTNSIEIKFEPSIVSLGTHQEFLYYQRDSYGKRRYEPPSYFSIAEIIARLNDIGLADLAKFGQRDDIDIFSTVARVASLDNDTMYSPFDFMVYNAVQRFNTHKCIRGFLVDLRIPVFYAPEFGRWEEDVFGQRGSSRLFALVTEAFSSRSLSATENRREQFQKRVWRIRDRIQHDGLLADMIRNIYAVAPDRIDAEFRRYFITEGIIIHRIGTVLFFDIDNHPDNNRSFDSAGRWDGYQVDVIIENEDGEPQSVWMKIPTGSPGPTWQPDFIYGGLCV